MEEERLFYLQEWHLCEHLSVELLLLIVNHSLFCCKKYTPPVDEQFDVVVWKITIYPIEIKLYKNFLSDEKIHFHSWKDVYQINKIAQ